MEVWKRMLKGDGTYTPNSATSVLISLGAMTCGVLSSVYVAFSLREAFGLFEGGELFAVVLFMPFFVLLLQIAFLQLKRC